MVVTAVLATNAAVLVELEFTAGMWLDVSALDIGHSYTWYRSSDIFFCRQEHFQSGRPRQQQKQLQQCFWREAQLLFLASAAARVFVTRI